jgi:hypothetical protein
MALRLLMSSLSLHFFPLKISTINGVSLSRVSMDVNHPTHRLRSRLIG